jgi:hypothetical protein
MKVATIFYHKNISSIYKKEWIEKSFNSVINQSFTKFSIYELNYGEDNLKLYREYPNNKEYHYYQVEMGNHADAMNFLIDECLKDGCDVIFNNNLDDYSHVDRFKSQLKYIKKGYDIISSNFNIIDETDKKIEEMDFSKKDVSSDLLVNHNIICHPSVCYSKRFFENNRYDPNEIPEEDLKLWKRTVNDYKFFICPEFLINYRKHGNQVTKNFENKKVAPKLMDIDFVQFNSFNNNFNNIERCKNCGEIKNRVNYNFCQKCNTIY